uniref:hypothetical protein n=1 Tax=Okeania sp. SIO2F4 TaxID=2607790 RepID=UPI0025E731E0|nr:hypothetical protein [Okeania sp. SIO2F4]
MNYVDQEESYKSIASSLKRDRITVYNADNPVKKSFSGRRVNRGLYQTKDGHLINADANGSFGIGLKIKHQLSFERVSRVCLTQPVRVNILQESPSISDLRILVVGLRQRVRNNYVL